jgi:L-lactate dehydrogenase (cytochrome)
MYARRGEVQAARAAASVGVSAALSTVSVCEIQEVAEQSPRAIWFQLYMLRDRGFMQDVLDRAVAAGVNTLVFTVDMPVPGARYRDRHSGMSGPGSNVKRMIQAFAHPYWAFSVGLLGRPHDLGNISRYRGKRTSLSDYIGWLGDNFDPSITWGDLDWIRKAWPGNLIIKGILDADDGDAALKLDVDALVVSNHGARQLDGTCSAVKALPRVRDAVSGRVPILMDSGIRSGLDVIRALCLGADAIMIGRPYIYALAAGGEGAVVNLLKLYKNEMRTAMTLMGVRDVSDLNTNHIEP